MPIFILFVLTITSALMLPVNPWLRDGWFLSQHRLFGSFIGEDNYTPIATPAIFYKFIHWLADAFKLGLANEFYMASIVQNLLVFISVCLIFWSCQKLMAQWISAFLSIILLCCLLSIGLPQTFLSENIMLFFFSSLLSIVHTADTKRSECIKAEYKSFQKPNFA
jgi:hypothetical protein